jgi:dihydrofolate reductase
MLIMVPIIFLINGLVRGDWFQALLFGLAVAVGFEAPPAGYFPWLVLTLVVYCLQGRFVMRRIRYQVACSLDGYIADAAGETGWIVDEPGIDFAELFEQFDTLLMGRLTYESLRNSSDGFWGKKVFVFSRTLRQEDHPAVKVVSYEVENTLRELRSLPGKDIWLFGGGQLFQSLLAMGCVDTVEPRSYRYYLAVDGRCWRRPHYRAR